MSGVESTWAPPVPPRDAITVGDTFEREALPGVAYEVTFSDLGTFTLMGPAGSVRVAEKELRDPREWRQVTAHATVTPRRLTGGFRPAFDASRSLPAVDPEAMLGPSGTFRRIVAEHRRRIDAPPMNDTPSLDVDRVLAAARAACRLYDAGAATTNRDALDAAMAELRVAAGDA